MKLPYIDFHCDTLMQAYEKKIDSFSLLPECMIDVGKLCTGGCRSQFFAIFMPPPSSFHTMTDEEDLAYIEQNLTIFWNTLNAHPDILAFAGSYRELEANALEGRISAFLTLEDGRAVNGRLERLEAFYGKGIRLISLTWNQKNCFGSPNSSNPSVMSEGLTPFGKEAVSYMQNRGILVDVSHLSDGGFWDVVSVSNKPFVASHSNCRSLNPHPRSMTDEMIRSLAEQGGIMGLNFAPSFLTGDTESSVSRIRDLMAQLHHMVKVGGIECAAIGTDFDGIGGTLEIPSADRMPSFFDAMEASGFTIDQIEKIAYKNAQRVIKDTL